MKKMTSLLLALALMLSVLVGCSSTNNGGNTNSGGNSDGDSGSSSVKVGFIITGGKLGDNAANDSQYAGLTRFSEEYGAELKYVEISELQDVEPAVRNYIDQGMNLIVFNSSEASDFIPTIAAEYPDVMFLVGEGTAAEAENILNYRTDVADASFLCGAFAALMSQELGGELAAGFVGGTRNPNLERSQYGFTAGVEYVGGEASVAYTNSFTDAATAKELTHQMFGSNIRVVQAFAGGANTGVFEAALNMGEGYYSMGGATGQFDLSDSIIASNCKFLGDLAYSLCVQYVEGTLPHGTVSYGLTDGAVDIAYAPDQRADIIPQEIKDTIDSLREMIINGEIDVPTTQDEYDAFAASTLAAQ